MRFGAYATDELFFVSKHHLEEYESVAKLTVTVQLWIRRSPLGKQDTRNHQTVSDKFLVGNIIIFINWRDLSNNPIEYVHKWSTPQLVFHGSRDFRLVEAEGLGVFHALQQYV